MPNPVVIKKYENRRLYDTSGSRYVNLPEIAQMIRDGAEVQVLDARSGDDLTRVILTQIIFEDARKKKGDLPLDFLRELIVTSDRALRDFVSWYAQAAQRAQKGAQEALGEGPLAPALPFIEKLLEGIRAKEARREAPRRPAEASSETETVVALRSRIEELERKLRRQGKRRKAASRPAASPRRAPARKREAPAEEER